MNLAAVKTVGAYAALGAIIGDVFATLIAPRFLTWYNTPGAGAVQTICDMKMMSETIFTQLIRAQAIGAGIGLGMGMAIGIRGVAHEVINRFFTIFYGGQLKPQRSPLCSHFDQQRVLRVVISDEIALG